MNLNQINLIGRVTNIPEKRVLQGGTVVVSFGLATNNIFTRNGQKVEEVDFHRITAFGKTAETIAQYVIKGQELYICGRIKYRTWDKQDGTKGYATDIICITFQFGQKPKDAVVPASLPPNYYQPPVDPNSTAGMPSVDYDEPPPISDQELF